jgi:hypothetical protein
LDRQWLVPVGVITAVQMLLWMSTFYAGIAHRPMFTTYGLLAIAFFAFVIGIRVAIYLIQMIRSGEEQPLRQLSNLAIRERRRIVAALIGLQLVALGGAAFGSLKAGLPPFWADLPIRTAEAAIFGCQAWEFLHRWLGWATPFFDRLYGTFVFTHTMAVFGLLACSPSVRKSQGLISLALAWLFMGVFCAYLLSSAGPLFFNRVYGDSEFAGLIAALNRDAPLTVMTAEALWNVHQSGIPMVGNGISAMPSMHVALTLWLALLLKNTRFAVIGWLYYALIWTGSVLLGWHWFSDGLVGSVGMILIWQSSPLLFFPTEATRTVTTSAA